MYACTSALVAKYIVGLPASLCVSVKPLAKGLTTKSMMLSLRLLIGHKKKHRKSLALAVIWRIGETFSPDY